jgi:Protein of unknown function (DUF4232)
VSKQRAVPLRPAVASTLAICGMLLLSACAPTPTSRLTPSARATQTPSPGVNVAPSAPTALVAACHASQLQVSLEQHGIGAGNIAFVITYQNVSTLTCALKGFPTVRAYAADGRNLEMLDSDTGKYIFSRPVATSLVLLMPRHSAYSTVGGSDFPVVSSMADATTLVVVPPDDSRGVRAGVPGNLYAGAGSLDLTAIQASYPTPG